MESKGRYGIEKLRLESTRRFLIYAMRTYRDINTYLKGLNINSDIWIGDGKIISMRPLGMVKSSGSLNHGPVFSSRRGQKDRN